VEIKPLTDIAYTHLLYGDGHDRYAILMNVAERIRETFSFFLSFFLSFYYDYYFLPSARESPGNVITTLAV